MEVHALTGQLYIVEGEARSTKEAPGLLVQAAPAKAARGRARDFLFVHLTLTGQLAETAVLAQDLLDTISQRYFQSSGSVTAALRRAVIDANDALLRLNLSGSGVTREGAISCAVLRNGELFMLQAGEALAFLGHNFGVERMPASQPERTTPMGRSAGAAIRYFHQRLQPGDMLLLADPRLAHLPTHAFEPALVDTEVELGVEALHDVVGPESARLLLVEFTDEIPTDVPDMARSDAGSASGPVRALTQRALQPKPRREGQEAVGAATVLRAPHLPSAEKVETTARRATSEAAMGLSRFTGWLAELLARLRSAPEDPDEPQLGWVLPTSVAVVIPLLVIVVVMGVYFQRGRVQRMAEIREEMSQSLVLAQDSRDDAVARDHYRQMLALAAEAESLRPNDGEVGQLRREAMTALDRLDGVTRLAARVYHAYEETADLSAVALREGFNGGVYTLDGANGTVYRHTTDESYLTPEGEPERVAFTSQSVGNHVVGRVIDLFWRPRGVAVSREGMAMLDAAGALLTYHPDYSDIRAVPLDLASEWQQPVAVATFDERLYVLDTGARQIWKYFPEGVGFLVKADDRAIAFDQNPGLEQAVDFDLYSEDASLVVVYEDGRIRYYDTRSGRIQWDETDLAQNGLTSPLVAPATVELVGRGLNASIFVADPGSNRIVQISRGGTVLAQYRATAEDGGEQFGRMSDFAIAERPLRIFVTADNILYVATQE